MKKIIYLTLTFIMMLSLVACDNNTKNSNTDNNSNQVTDKDDKEINKQTYTGEITEDVLRSHPETSVSDFEYERSLKYDGIMITRYLGNDDIVVVPEQIDGESVVEVAGYVFGNNSQVRGVVLPNTVIEISELFINNSKVEMVIAEGLQKIGYASFLNCDSLREVILGDNITDIGVSAFAVCVNLEKLVLPATINNMTKNAQYSAFSECPKLTIYGEKGSYIERIANERSIPFVAE